MRLYVSQPHGSSQELPSRVFCVSRCFFWDGEALEIPTKKSDFGSWFSVFTGKKPAW